MIHKKTGIIAWFAKNNVAANLLMFLIIVAGIFSAFSIKKELFPEIVINRVSVNISYSGATAEQIEELVLIKIEESVSDISGVSDVISNAKYGSGYVYVTIDSDYDSQEVFEDIKEEVEGISGFPDDMSSPKITLLKSTEVVLSVALYGNRDYKFLKEEIKDIRDDLRALPEVSKVSIDSIPKYKIYIDVSEDKLLEFELTFDEVSRKLQQNSISVPSGSIKTENGSIYLRVNNQAYTGDDFGDIVIKSANDGSLVYLKDIAKIVDGFVDDDFHSTFNKQNSLSLDVIATKANDSLAVSEAVINYVAQKSKTLPPDCNLVVWQNSSYYLKGRLDMMLDNMYTSVFLVFLVLSLFLDITLAFWVIIGLPICFLGTLAVMSNSHVDLSINVLTLFAFILVLGIVVDDAIIIGESASSSIEKNGLSYESVVSGVYKVAMPATFGVLTTIAAFMPMLFINNPMSTIWQSIAGVVILCLIFSLIESKLILPAHLVSMNQKKKNFYFLNPAVDYLSTVKCKFNDAFRRFIDVNYCNFIKKSIQNRYSVLAIFLGVLLIIFGLIGSGKVRWVFFPDIPRDSLDLSIEMNIDENKDSTYEAIKKIEEALYKTDDYFYQQSGDHVVLNSFLNVTGDLQASMEVELTKGETREFSSNEILEHWRNNIPDLVGLDSLDFSSSKNNSKPISFNLTSDNFNSLQKVIFLLSDKLMSYDGVFDVNNSYSKSNKEISLRLSEEGKALGINLHNLARQVRNGFHGLEVQKVLRNREELSVVIRYPKEERESINHLQNMIIYTNSGQSFPLSSVALINVSNSSSDIFRINYKRSVTLEAGADKNKVEPGKIAFDVLDYFNKEIKGDYPDVSLSLYGSSKDEGQTMNSVMYGAVLVLFVIYALIAIPLNSYSQPIIVMIVIPFSLIGAVLGHMLLGIPLNILSIMGIVALIGVVVNDSLILVHCVNQNKDTMDLRDAVVESGCYRFRAIVLTSLTTFFGIAPILLETSLQAQIVIPMATSLAFGILFATTVTLILVPIIYIIFDDIGRLYKYVCLKLKPA